MKKLIVKDGCIGCGACVAIDSEHFDFNDEGLSSVISNENLESAELQNAMASCPVSVIKLEETTTCNCHEGCTCGEDCKCTSENKCSEECTCANDCECGEGCNCHE